MAKLPRVHWAAIGSAALLLRFATVEVVAKGHDAPWFFNQATELARLAESLRTGQGLSSPFGGATGPSAFLSPGYPSIVAAIFALFHPYSFAAAAALMTMQALFGVATVLVILWLARQVFNPQTANVTGIICALAPPALFLPTLFWETSLSVLLATSLFAVAAYLVASPTTARWISLSLTAAAAIAVNPSLLPIAVCCAGWALYSTRTASTQPATLTGPVTAAILFVALSTPWAVRNYVQLHAFIPLRSNMGYELWQGNRPGSDGFFAPEFHPNVNPAEFHAYASLGEVQYMQAKGRAARELISADPLHFLALTARRALYFWTGVGRTSSGLVVAYITCTSLFGLTGLFVLWRRNRTLAALFLLPLLLFPAPYYITHPDFRFRLVLDPVLVALGVAMFVSRSKSKQSS